MVATEAIRYPGIGKIVEIDREGVIEEIDKRGRGLWVDWDVELDKQQEEA